MRQKKGSIQRSFLPIRQVLRNGIGCYAGPHSRLYRTALEVTGVNFRLLSEQEQRVMFEGYQQYFASLSFPTQLIVRVSRLDLDSYLQYLTVAKQHSDEVWAELAQSHTSFVRGLSEKMLLERRFYIVVPADDVHLGRMPKLKFGKEKRKEEEQTLDQAEQQLELRCELVSTALQQLGLHVRQLNNEELVRLIDDCLGTQRTVQYPLAVETLEGTMQGQARIEDILAPASIRVEPDHIVLEEQEFLCSLAVRAFPRVVTPGFLQSVVMLDEPMDLVFHQFPVPQNEALGLLRKKQAQYESSKLYLQEKGRAINPHINIASQDIAPLVDQVAGSQEQLHNHSFHILVRGTSKDDLQRRVRRVRETVHTTCSHRPHIMFFEQDRGMKQCLPGNFAASDPMLLDSSSLAAAFPFFSNLVYRPTEASILEGITADQEPVVADWWGELTNYNRFVIAPSGRGKSHKTKHDIMRVYMMFKAKAARQGIKDDLFQISVIDPDREYIRLCKKLKGQHVRFSPGSQHHLNPFDLPQSSKHQREEAGSNEKENVLANHIQKLHMLLDMMLSYRSPDNPNETLSIEEKSVLDIALYETYRKVGITSDRQTHNRQPPLLRDLYHTLMSGDCRPEECEPEEAVIAQASEPDPVAQGLARRLRRYVYGSLSGLFSGPTNVELNNSFIVFDVKELDDELRPLALMMITNLTWNMTFASRIPRLLIIDELATLYRYRSGAKFAEEAFQRGRKQYLGIVGITQHPHLFKDSAIIANCATHILLGQDHTTIDLVSDMFKLSPREAQLLKNIKRGEGLMLVDGKRMHVKFQGSDLENSLAHTDPRELAELELEEEAPAEPLKELAVAAPGAEQINGNHQ